MSQYGWEDCPEAIRNQVERFLGAVREVLWDNLVGVYLHGSLAMGCFNPERSDIDLLAVMERGMSVDTKRAIVQLLLRHSKAPCPIEVSFLSERDLDPWEYPTPFDLHYSEEWREQYEEHLSSGEWRRWNERQDKDPDLAAHITVTSHRGICLCGRPIEEVFPAVPREHYIASLMCDFDDARDGIVKNPIYGILNLCRVYWYLLEGRIPSKDEAGDWAAHFLPGGFREIAARALKVYRGDLGDEHFADVDLEGFVEYIDEEIKALLAREGR